MEPFVKYFPQSHTGEHINLEINGMVKYLGLDDPKIIKIVATDTAGNALKSIRLSDDLISQKCVNHKLNLCVMDVLEGSQFEDSGPNSVKHVVNMATQLATKCKNTPSKHRELENACKEVGIVFTTLKLRVKVRWNSTQTCMKSVLKLKAALLLLRNENPDVWAEIVPDEVQFKVMEAVCRVLEEPLRATKIWEADKSETIHVVTQELYNMTCNLENLSDSPTESQSVKEFAKMLLGRLNARFPNHGTEDLLQAMGNYLNPDLRGLHLEDFAGLKEKTKSEMKKMFESEENSNDLNDTVESNEDQVDFLDLSELNPTERRIRMRALQKARLESRPTAAEEKGLDLEFKVYEALPMKDPNTEALKWWKERRGQLPLLYEIVRVVFSVPASSSTSERIFSICGNLATKKRVRLDVKKLEELTVINRNYRRVKKLLLQLKPKIEEKRIQTKGSGKDLKDSIIATVDIRRNVLDEYGIIITDDENEESDVEQCGSDDDSGE